MTSIRRIQIPKLRTEHAFIGFLILFWGKDILFRYFKAVLLRIPVVCLAADYVIPALMILCLLFSLPYLLKAVSPGDILFISAVIAIYFLNIALYPANREQLWTISSSFFTAVLPLYFIGLRFEAGKHLNLLYKLSILNIWLFAVYTSFIGDAMGSSQAAYSGSMHRAYVLLPQLLLVTAHLIRKANLLNFATAAVGLVFLLVCGNRGSLLCFVVFLLIYSLFLLGKKLRFRVYCLIVLLGVFIICFFDQLINAILSFAARLGMSPRAITALISGSFLQSNSRSVIAQKLLAAIAEHPLFGCGLGADRVICDTYAHNFALELWTSFGVIFGTLLLLAVFFLIAKGWLKSKDWEGRVFLLLLFCTGFVKLFISNSYLHEGPFFLLLGLCAAQLRKRSKQAAQCEEKEHL